MWIALLLLFLVAPAFAQPATTIPAPIVQQAIGQKLIDEVNENVRLRAQLLQLQEQIDRLKAVKESENKEGPSEERK